MPVEVKSSEHIPLIPPPKYKCFASRFTLEPLDACKLDSILMGRARPATTMRDIPNVNAHAKTLLIIVNLKPKWVLVINVQRIPSTLDSVKNLIKNSAKA